jgi:hypothetical protein
MLAEIMVQHGVGMMIHVSVDVNHTITAETAMVGMVVALMGQLATTILVLPMTTALVTMTKGVDVGRIPPIIAEFVAVVAWMIVVDVAMIVVAVLMPLDTAMEMPFKIVLGIGIPLLTKMGIPTVTIMEIIVIPIASTVLAIAVEARRLTFLERVTALMAEGMVLPLTGASTLRPAVMEKPIITAAMPVCMITVAVAVTAV